MKSVIEMPKKKKQPNKSIDIFTILGIALLVVGIFAVAIIILKMPKSCTGISCTGGNISGEINYSEIARQFVLSSEQYAQHQGTNIRETSRRFISDSVYEYTFAFDKGNTNASVNRGFEMKILVTENSIKMISINELGSGFCGLSSFDPCLDDSECVIGGCSGQICQSKNTEPVFTTCEYRDCYNAQQYEIICKCYQQTCRWI